MLLPLMAYAPFILFKADNYYPRLVMPGVLISLTSLMMMARLDPGPLHGRERSSVYFSWALIFAAALGQFAVLDALGHGAILLMLIFGLLLAWTIYSHEHFEMPDWIAKSVWTLAGFILLSLLLFGLSPRTGMDMDLPGYWQAARAFIQDGSLKRFDYPFMSNLFYALPGSLASSLAGFEWGFGLMCGLLALGVAWLQRGVLKSHGRSTLAAFWPWLFLAAPFQMWYSFARYDVIPVALLVLALVLWLRGLAALCMVILAVGFWTKFFPALAAPPLLIALWLGMDRKKAVIATLAAMAAFILPLLLYPLDDLLKPFVFQGGRGMTGESLWYQIYHGLTRAMRRSNPGRAFLCNWPSSAARCLRPVCCWDWGPGTRPGCGA